MSDISYRYCGLDKDKFRKAVIETRSSRMMDSLVTEFVYFYVAPKGTKIFSVKEKSVPKRIHKYLLWPNGIIVDLIADGSPDDYPDSDYIKASEYKNIPIKPGTDTERLAELLGFSEDDLDLEEEEDG